MSTRTSYWISPLFDKARDIIKHAAIPIFLIAIVNGSANAEVVTIKCPGPTADTDHSLTARDPKGINATIPAGQTVKECNSIDFMKIVGVACRVKPYQEAAGWNCETGVPCASGVTFSQVEFNISGTPTPSKIDECVTVTNSSPFPRDIQVSLHHQ
jgi:hypothetical protein